MEWNELGAWGNLIDFPREKWDALSEQVERAYESTEVYPPREKLFAALNATPPEQVRVVILGQDPYHEPGQAHGLSFSVEPGVAIPKSLGNIYKEMESDLGLEIPKTGCLLPWANNGVLLLNSVLTVEQKSDRQQRPERLHGGRGLARPHRPAAAAEGHRGSPQGGLSSKVSLGAVYGSGNQGDQFTAPAHCLCALGQLCHQKSAADSDKCSAIGADLSASQSPVRLSRLLWQPSV